MIPDSTNYLVINLAGQIPNADAYIRLRHDELLSAAAAVSDATGTGDIVTQFNELLANLRSVGILAEQ